MVQVGDNAPGRPGAPPRARQRADAIDERRRRRQRQQLRSDPFCAPLVGLLREETWRRLGRQPWMLALPNVRFHICVFQVRALALHPHLYLLWKPMLFCS